MAERIPRGQAKPPQHPDEYKRTVYACGERKDHLIRVHRAQWPPKLQPGVTDSPFIAGVCERCGANAIVYNPPSADMTVVLYGDAADVVGRVVDEKGKVIDEAAVPKGGQVVDDKGKR